ncbi:hypothetical protein IX39_07380 [Chryseobacterium formosense]|uniref:Uncharacterized protein n=1 Tax=Chryseobacterium formosense TaxID=236814 RepID=A0A085Z7P6_9FLAO|nr:MULTISPECIES: hypothetical protein [Chryseobacterium]KFF00460.1 hypothetical protein IX39_07380 [Chryseobacterium formosense]OCK50712.1 hypothetical protein BA768_19315 [Chryseobacterium sp. CBo1]SFT34060.1 hypothetical protein SAMN05421857_0178 [Chryseobacterium formosense]
MSRIRIVKGKIFESTGEDLNYYSETNISENSAEYHSEKSETVIKKDGNPGKPPASPTLSKCAVFFRPTKNWKGEFGFDWVRVADTKLETDISYNGIIGNYGKVYATNTNDPKNLPKFTPDTKKYNGILTEYNNFGVYKGKYYVPNMTLIAGETAVLDAIVHIEEKPDKLHYAYNTDVFEIIILKQFTVAKGTNFDESSVSIKCKKIFTSPETIRIIATKNKLMQKVGEIKVLPNNKIKNVNIIMIPVTVKKMNSTGSVKGNEKVITQNAFNQSYIKANILEKTKPIIADGFLFNLFFTTKDKNGNIVTDISNWRSIHSTLDKIFFEDKKNEIYKSYYRVYMLPTSLNLNGIAEDVGNVKTVVAFQNRNDSSTAHEILHAMGLYHTFDNNSPYTFKLYNTDNIMDYTHQTRNPKTNKMKSRFSTNKFQWKKINEGIK